MNTTSIERSEAAAGNPRRAYYDRIAAHSMTPLWEVLGTLQRAHRRADR